MELEAIEQYKPKHKKAKPIIQQEIKQQIKTPRQPKQKTISKTMTVKNEKDALELITDKIALLQAWLIKSFDNPYASRVRKDLSALQVERSTKERVIENLEIGNPSHGQELHTEHKTDKI